MMPRPHSWHPPSPGHRPAGRPDPVERLAVPVASPELARDTRPAQDAAGEAARSRPTPRPH
ncbi:hypothetical protein [Novilysobacter erysipheiresistens]